MSEQSNVHCPLCNAGLRGVWGIYSAIWDCGTSRVDEDEPKQSANCLRMCELQTEIERLRLERDVLAMNGGKDSCVQVIWDGGNIASVWWPTSQTASERAVKMPQWYLDNQKAAEAEGK